MDNITAIFSAAIFVAMLLILALANEIQILKKRHANEIERMRTEFKNVRTTNEGTQRAVIKGQLAEQFFPIMPQNTHEPSDMRFLGDFCDYIVVDGYGRCKDEGLNYIDAVTFIEIKTGKARLSRHQKLIRDAVEAGRVRWETIRLD